MSPATRIVVVGSANIDLCIRLPRLPSPGETRGGGFYSQSFGGKGANAAVGAAQAGADVFLVACVGLDSFGDAMLENLRRKKVSAELISRSPNVPTGTALIFLDATAENMIGVAPGANDTMTAGRIDELRGELRKAHVVLVQNEVPVPVVSRVLEIAREDHLKVLYNFAPARELPTGLESIAWLVVN